MIEEALRERPTAPDDLAEAEKLIRTYRHEKHITDE